MATEPSKIKSPALRATTTEKVNISCKSSRVRETMMVIKQGSSRGFICIRTLVTFGCPQPNVTKLETAPYEHIYIRVRQRELDKFIPTQKALWGIGWAGTEEPARASS